MLGNEFTDEGQALISGIRKLWCNSCSFLQPLQHIGVRGAAHAEKGETLQQSADGNGPLFDPAAEAIQIMADYDASQWP